MSSSDLPKVAAKSPMVMELEPGEYWWCACGLAAKQPFCSGAHAGTGISPLAFTLSEKKKVALCTCKQTLNAPYCDGSHKKLG